jgi:hypothetical protein
MVVLESSRPEGHRCNQCHLVAKPGQHIRHDTSDDAFVSTMTAVSSVAIRHQHLISTFMISYVIGNAMYCSAASASVVSARRLVRDHAL